MFEWFFNYLACGPLFGATPFATSPLDLGFRSIAAGALAMILVLLGGPAGIRWLKARFCDPLKSGSAELDRLHRAKNATPTLGGILIVAVVTVIALSLTDFVNRLVLLALASTVGLALVGVIDDLVKLRTRAAGLGWKAKLLGQCLVAAIPASCFFGGWCTPSPMILSPVASNVLIAMPLVTIPWTMLVIVATSNAVNLTDGLDGLAAGCLALVAAAMGVVAYVGAEGPARELVVVTAALVGGLLGFLRFNRHPAQVFMGNVGSVSLGGLLGFLAVATGTELLLPLVGAILVAETASVILQVGMFRLKRRRIFLCAPLHHHFEFLGWPEPMIVRRFWVVTAVSATIGVGAALGGLATSRPSPAAPSTLVAAGDAALPR
ncbi:MAG TPA: phospho-N-acetylmuramoyl-pentapeptide-transferase [Pirellulales bacterium]|jgi:phospho-N-acetylmuramoyl-pentapeptide-transferase